MSFIGGFNSKEAVCVQTKTINRQFDIGGDGEVRFQFEDEEEPATGGSYE